MASEAASSLSCTTNKRPSSSRTGAAGVCALMPPAAAMHNANPPNNRFARSVGDEAPVAIAPRQFHGVQRFRHRTDLVQLDEDGVSDSFVDSFLQDLGIGAEDIVSHQFDLASESNGQIPPAVPVVFPHAILEEHDGVLVYP